MKYILYGFFLLMSNLVFAQVADNEEFVKRPISKEEVRLLGAYTDSVLTELKKLYKLEVQENSPRKYQPERIALVRSYLLVFKTIEDGCDVVAYSTKDIKQIFGQPDTIIYTGNSSTQSEWLYGKVQTKYVRISNLRYRFYFKNGKLEAVRRDDKQG